ncbi:MAG: NAD(P)-binding domain-containing protein [Bacteroidales bacterium]|nr:NAD(P)-binding domain-containing protein [Bacteroidales bacterium]
MIGVIGSGSWATAIVKILMEQADRMVNWWVRSDEVRNGLLRDGHNPKHLPNVQIDTSRTNISGDIAKVVSESEYLFLVIPSAFIASVLDQLPRSAYKGKKFISAIKGVVPDKRVAVSTYLETTLKIKRNDICVISGPTHAEEASLCMPTFLTMASNSPSLAVEVEQMMRCPYLHTTHTTDILAVERVGLLKNVYAIAAGICQGLGYGDNLNAVMVSAAMRELCHLIQVFPSTNRNIADNCYLGDLMVTCWSKHSRNRRLGEEIAKGLPLDEIFKEMGTVAEGYYSAKNYHELGMMIGRSDDMPIVEAVYRVLYEGTDPKDEIDALIDTVF